MLRNIEEINRSKKVSSKNTRELTDDLYNSLSRNFHRLLQIHGMVRTSTVCLELTNASMMTVLASAEKDEPHIINITAYDECLFPTAISDNEQAERSQEFVTITSKRVNSRSIFVDENDILNSSLEFTKAIKTSDEKIPKYIIENSIENAFKGDLPYVSRFVKDEVKKTTLELQILSKDQPFTLNAIRYIPMPAMGAITLDSMTYDGGKHLVTNGDCVLPDVNTYAIDRTYQGYIHFEPIETSTFCIQLSSEVYLSALSCTAIGITKIIGEFNTYALKSYIGWKITYPYGYTQLKNITIFPATYSTSMKHVRIKIYDNSNDFNEISDRYIIQCGENTEVNIQQSTVPEPYILMELDSVSNTTPCVGRIRLEFA